MLDERFIGRAGVHAYDPLRLAVDVRGLAVDGHQLATMLREIGDINLELAGENVIVGVFGMGEPAAALADRFVAALRVAARARPGSTRAARPRPSRPRRPGASW